MLDDNFSYNKIYLLSCISKVKKKNLFFSIEMINLCTKVHKKCTMEPTKSSKSRLTNPNFSKYKETNYNKKQI